MLKPTIAAIARAVLAMLALAASCAQAATAGASAVVPTGEIVEDRTPEMWAARWWMWAVSFSYEESPVADRDGSRCNASQEGDTFFLAGVYGSRPVHRTCTVPRDKYLFFPLISFVAMADGGTGDCTYFKAHARTEMDNATLFAELDGKAIADLASRRAAPAKCFNINARSHGPNVASAADGYWLMLRPLAPGRHTLRFGGEAASFGQDITYTLLVE